MDAEKLFAEIIASRPDITDKYMESPESLYAEIVHMLEGFNSKRTARAEGLTARDGCRELGDYLPDIEINRLMVPAEFLKPVDISQLPDLKAFVLAMLGAVVEDEDSQYQKPLTIYSGDTGTGKTRTAYFKVVGYNEPTYCVSACHLKRIVSSIFRSPDESNDYFKMLCAVDKLFIDDLTMCKFTQPLFELFIEVLNHRTCNDMLTYLTMQAPPDCWRNMLLDQGIDRLLIDGLFRRLDDFAYLVEFEKED